MHDRLNRTKKWHNNGNNKEKKSLKVRVMRLEESLGQDETPEGDCLEEATMADYFSIRAAGKATF